LVTFDDTAITTAVNLTTALLPSAFTNNTAATYTFGGVGKISGTTSLVKQGGGTLILTNAGLNDFSGGVILSAGTVQVGNGTTLGSLPASGAVLDNGSLSFNHSDAVAFAGAISGSGAVTQNGSGTLTLSGSSSFSGGLAINAGAVRANAVTAPGTGLVTVNSGATFVTGAAHTNSITLNNAIIGTSLSGGFTMSTNMELTIAANSTNLIYSSDPQNNVSSFQFLVDANLRGSGAIVCINAPTNSPDSGQGVRFRNTNAVSDFSGTIIYTNGTKGELLTLTPAGGAYSPIGAGKLILYCGAYDGGNVTTGPANGTGYCELNLRNNGPGSVIIGNDVSLLGSGAAVLNALAGTGGITMGNLKIGAGQELIGYKAASTATNTLIFTSATLTGGNATFSPHSTTFGIASQAGTDFSLGGIGEQTAGSGIIKGGLGNLTLTGVNTYSGDTIVGNGVLLLSGSASIANSPHIVVAGGAKLDVSALASTFALGAAQTLSNSSSTAVISGNADASLGIVSVTYSTNAPSFTITNGALTLAAGTTFQIKNTGPALTGGSYKIISAANTGNAGSVVGTAPTSVAVGGSGIATAVTPSLQISGNELFLVVPNTPPVVARIVTNSTSAGLTWKIAISDLATSAGWSDADNNTLTLNSVGPTSNLGNSVTADTSFIYYNVPVTAEDFFTYTITDGSATANGTVYLETVTPPPAPATASQIVKDGNGVPTITFAGIPGRTNVVEASTNLTLWTAISTNVAGTDGLWQVTDPDATNFVNRFYRSYQPYP
jgi:autotransporter-associated beta strand protein